MEIILLAMRLSARAFATIALAAVVAAAPSAAQTGLDTDPPAAAAPSSPAASSSSETVAPFVTGVMPTANFIATASRMAIIKSRSSKIWKFAETLAKDQSAIARSLSAWVNVTGPVVTRSGSGARISAPNFLPFQVENLRRLSASQGSDFDKLFVTTQVEALTQLQSLYRGFIQNGTDPGLSAIAMRELPNVEQAISTLDNL